MTIFCPCCRARNESVTACRRCRADLSMLLDYLTWRNQAAEAARCRAVQALRLGDFPQAARLYFQWRRAAEGSPS